MGKESLTADKLKDLDEIPAEIAFAGGEAYDEDEEVVGDRGDGIDDDVEAPAKEPAKEAEPEEAEEAEEAEEVEDTEAEEVVAEPAKEPAKDVRIPKERFDQVNERMKAAERKLRELEAQQEATGQAETGTYDFDQAESAAAELLLDGRMEEYTAKRKEIRAAQEAEWGSKVQNTSQSTYTQQRENDLIQERALEFQTMYPALDSENETFDEGLLDEVVVQMDSYERLGHDRVTAFEKAVKNVAKIYDLQSDAPPPPVAKPKTAVKPARSAKDKQPPAPTGQHGDRSDLAGAAALDVDNLSDDEFEALPTSKLREMRGDLY